MLYKITIRFSPSRSANYRRAMLLARQLPGFTQSAEQVSVGLTPEQIYASWETFAGLFAVASSWKSFQVLVNDEPTVKAMTLFYQLQEIRDCFVKYQRVGDAVCNSCDWKCRLVKSVKTRPHEWGTFWYSFGHFSDDYHTWVIHKDELHAWLRAEIADRRLHLCPAFLEDVVLAVADAFPDKIDLRENHTWGVKTEKRFVGASIVDVPVSVYHRLDDDPELDFSLPDVGEDDNEDSDVNPYPEGSDAWANWEIDKHLRKKR